MSSSETVSIQPIDKTSVNQICSGQVVLNLAIAVKELLENSIDAGADSVQIKLEEYGSESIEVIDNGSGVEEVNFQALSNDKKALKHHTSKIREFSDLYNVETFGFRGEALSSLCALSDVTIITQHKNSDIGATLKFDHNGIITSNVKTLRKTGTTVKLENLFSTLPIRRTEFLKNLKREYCKMCNILYAYGLQSKGVRITCTNHVLKSKLTTKEIQGENSKRSINTVMDTRGGSLESNIVSVFGIKQKQNLLKITEKPPTQETLTEYNLTNKHLNLEKFKLEGYISSCAHGCGRSGSDRQFYFINSRPIDNQKISKLVNDIYHQYNNRQDPFVVLNIKVECGSFDMNVTPDKRQVLLQNERLLFAVLKESLNGVFEKVPSTMDVQNVGLIRGASTGEESGMQERIEKFRARFNCGDKNAGEKTKNEKDRKSVLSGLSEFRAPSKTSTKVSLNVTDNNPTTHKIKPLMTTPEEEYRPPGRMASVSDSQDSLMYEKKFRVWATENGATQEPAPQNSEEVPSSKKICQETAVEESSADIRIISSHSSESKRKLHEKFEEVMSEENDSAESYPKKMRFDEGLAEEDKKRRKTVLCNISLSDIKESGLKNLANRTNEEVQPEVKFLVEIKPQSNERAENELKKELNIDSFAQMEIIGQFNLGFIITKLAFDLFLIDQHASDEKYNYETLRATTVMQTQKLINPEKLELTVDKEEMMLQHRDVFKKNGFDFVFDDEAPATRRISLTSIPMSKNWVFGKDDVDELLFLLEDATEIQNLRLPRVNDMFASRACRKSVMIGTPLNQQEMRRIVDHMGKMQQPWNCPHGRPTVRHLLNLNMIHTKETN